MNIPSRQTGRIQTKITCSKLFIGYPHSSYKPWTLVTQWRPGKPKIQSRFRKL